MTDTTPRWAHMVASVPDLRAYKTVVLSMFDDGRVTLGRLVVLKQFTDDVCDQIDHPDSIRHYYENVALPSLKDMYQATHCTDRSVVMFTTLGCLAIGLVYSYLHA